MRYGRIEDLFRLALLMQGTREGLSLDDIGREFGVGRRTSERMRDAILRVFPRAEEVETGERVKRWRLPPGTIDGFAVFDAGELASLDAAAKLLRRENMGAASQTVEAVAAKAAALARRRGSPGVETDRAALVEAEGLALRPGPRPSVNPIVLDTLRHAVLAARKVRLAYRARGTGVLSRQIVCPYGFLYGGRHYLVAYSMGVRAYRLFSLPNIEKAEATEWGFERRPFSLADFARGSFGVFQGEPLDVVWEFSPRAAPEARAFTFHPTEQKTELPGGRLRVSFRASGALEMSWHLAMWGQEVKVIAPRDFKTRVAREERDYWSRG
ncbi:MAG: helix-turn-helix transcriptional regulator [Alphaproteobacteria bacterium]